MPGFVILLYFCILDWEYGGAFGFLYVIIHTENAGYVYDIILNEKKWSRNCLWTFLDLIIEAMSALEMEMNWSQG